MTMLETTGGRREAPPPQSAVILQFDRQSKPTTLAAEPQYNQVSQRKVLSARTRSLDRSCSALIWAIIILPFALSAIALIRRLAE